MALRFFSDCDVEPGRSEQQPRVDRPDSTDRNVALLPTRRDDVVAKPPALATLLALGSSSALCCPLSLHFAYLLICICESQSSHVLCSPSTISCLCPSILPAFTIDVRTNDAPIDDFGSFFLEILRLLLTSSSAMVASYFSFNLL